MTALCENTEEYKKVGARILESLKPFGWSGYIEAPDSLNELLQKVYKIEIDNILVELSSNPKSYKKRIIKRINLCMPAVESFLFLKFIYRVTDYDNHIAYLLKIIIGKNDVREIGTKFFSKHISIFIDNLKKEGIFRLDNFINLGVVTNPINERYCWNVDNTKMYKRYIRDLKKYLNGYINMVCSSDDVNINYVPYYFNVIAANTGLISLTRYVVNSKKLLSRRLGEITSALEEVKEYEGIVFSEAEERFKDAYHKIDKAISETYNGIVK